MLDAIVGVLQQLATSAAGKAAVAIPGAASNAVGSALQGAAGAIGNAAQTVGQGAQAIANAAPQGTGALLQGNPGPLIQQGLGQIGMEGVGSLLDGISFRPPPQAFARDEGGAAPLGAPIKPQRNTVGSVFRRRGAY